jgi:hypothetical protein
MDTETMMKKKITEVFSMKETEAILKMLADGLKTLAGGIEKISVKVNEMAATQKETAAGPAKQTKSGKKPSASTSRRRAPVKTDRKPAANDSRRRKSTKSGQKTTAMDTVFQTISRSKNGADTATIRKRTGFDAKKVQNIIYKLKKQGRIHPVAKGVYRKA